jgi:Flp pilus assembly protein protease CpaA
MRDIQPHFFLALIVLLIISIIDFYQRRIPNVILLSAVALHIVLSLFFSHDFNHRASIYLIITFLLFLMFFQKQSLRTLERIGMGDLKLFLYLIWIFSAYISWSIWLITLSFISIFIFCWLYFMKKNLDQAIAFAPIASSATVISLFLPIG